jgi:hypothetical protein
MPHQQDCCVVIKARPAAEVFNIVVACALNCIWLADLSSRCGSPEPMSWDQRFFDPPRGDPTVPRIGMMKALLLTSRAEAAPRRNRAKTYKIIR